MPLRIRNSRICTPKTTAAVEIEAAKVLMLWFSLFCAAPALGAVESVDVGRAEFVLDMLRAAEMLWN